MKYIIKKEKLIEKLNSLPADSELVLDVPSLVIFGSNDPLMLIKYN